VRTSLLCFSFDRARHGHLRIPNFLQVYFNVVSDIPSNFAASLCGKSKKLSSAWTFPPLSRTTNRLSGPPAVCLAGWHERLHSAENAITKTTDSDQNLTVTLLVYRIGSRRHA
jgi:hypothetical protein